MKITLLSGDRLRVEGGAGPMTIEADSAEMTYSAFHMLASGLGTCTLTVLHAWAANAKLPADGIAVEVGWSFVENPHRVGAIQVEVEWPGLPPERHAAAARVADLCTVKATLQHPPEITTAVRPETAAAA